MTKFDAFLVFVGFAPLLVAAAAICISARIEHIRQPDSAPDWCL